MGTSTIDTGVDRPRGRAVREALMAHRRSGRRDVRQIGAEHLALEQIKTVDIPAKIYFERGAGAVMTDADGREYIDLIMGFGAHLLGHRPPAVEAAVREQLGKGWHFGLNNTLQGEHARRMAGLGLGDQSKLLYCGSGSEATSYACRVARAFTGRTRIGVFDGSYHGSHDYALVRSDMSSAPERSASRILGAGVPETIRSETMLTLPFRDERAFDLIRRGAKDIAAILVQAVQNNLPRLDSGWFLEGLRAVCDETGVLLIFDEVVTGLRIGHRGAQGHFRIAPDLTCYGKAIGGGLPVGALAGRAQIMDLFPRADTDGGVFSSGTFNANPLTMAAGLATLEVIESMKDSLYADLDRKASALSGRVNRFAEARRMTVRMMNAGSMLHLGFEKTIANNAWERRAPTAEQTDDFFLHMLSQGVLMPASRMTLISSAHSDAQMEHVGDAIEYTLGAMQEDGLI